MNVDESRDLEQEVDDINEVLTQMRGEIEGFEYTYSTTEDVHDIQRNLWQLVDIVRSFRDVLQSIPDLPDDVMTQISDLSSELDAFMD